MSDNVIRHVVVRGRVQGVGYRAFVEDEAYRRGLRGWVRNRRDGSVEAVFAGPRAAVNQWLKPAAGGQCRRGSARSISAKAPRLISRTMPQVIHSRYCPRSDRKLVRTAVRIPVGGSCRLRPSKPTNRDRKGW